VKLERFEEARVILDNAISVLNEKRTSKALDEVENDMKPEVLPMAYAARAQIIAQNPDELELAMEQLQLAMGIIKQDHRVMRGANATLYYTGKVSEIFDQAQALKYHLGAERQNPDEISQVLAIGELNKTVLLKNRLNSFESISYSGIPDSILKQEQTIVDRLGQGLIGDGMTLDEAQTAYRNLLDKLRSEYPKYFDLKYGEQEVRLSDIQEHLIDPGQTLLSYTMHDDGVILVAVDKSEAQMFEMKIDSLPEKIERLGSVTMSMDMEAFEQSARILYAELFAPAIDFIKGKEIIIIPDDELYLLNFELLIAPSEGEADAVVPRYLIHNYTISYILSASTALQFERLGRDSGQGTLALAPGFSDQMKSEYQASVKDTLHLDQTYLRLIKQPFAVSTAQGLGKVLSATVLTGSEANEKRFKTEAEQYGLIHLGTHTEVNDVSPLFSKLFLSKSDSIDEDGYLHAYEIYDMELKAELAVLTACETGKGRKAKAEGLRSLAHGFAYAGCPSIVMSLWKIDEKTSAEITDSFYGYLAEGQAKNVALRSAKLDFISNNPDLTAPYYWAGIVLMGDVSPIAGHKSFSTFYLLGAIVLIVLLVMLYRRLS
jgi:CHAT domain-containing protein